MEGAGEVRQGVAGVRRMPDRHRGKAGGVHREHVLERDDRHGVAAVRVGGAGEREQALAVVGAMLSTRLAPTATSAVARCVPADTSTPVVAKPSSATATTRTVSRRRPDGWRATRSAASAATRRPPRRADPAARAASTGIARAASSATASISRAGAKGATPYTLSPDVWKCTTATTASSTTMTSKVAERHRAPRRSIRRSRSLSGADTTRIATTALASTAAAVSPAP